MSEKRRDHRGRILHNREIQLSDGRYRFKYVDEMGKERCVYSWRLDHNDATPKGKRSTSSLREMEKKISSRLHQVNVFLDRKFIVDIFKRKIANQFFRRFI